MGLGWGHSVGEVMLRGIVPGDRGGAKSLLLKNRSGLEMLRNVRNGDANWPKRGCGGRERKVVVVCWWV